MKIAAMTKDGKTISPIFDETCFYLVVTLEDDGIHDCQLRDTRGRSEFTLNTVDVRRTDHGNRTRQRADHNIAVEAIQDCQVVLCRGTQAGAYERLRARGIRLIVTDIVSIGDAVMAFLNGKMVNRAEHLL